MVIARASSGIPTKQAAVMQRLLMRRRSNPRIICRVEDSDCTSPGGITVGGTGMR